MQLSKRYFLRGVTVTFVQTRCITTVPPWASISALLLSFPYLESQFLKFDYRICNNKYFSSSFCLYSNLVLHHILPLTLTDNSVNQQQSWKLISRESTFLRDWIPMSDIQQQSHVKITTINFLIITGYTVFFNLCKIVEIMQTRVRLEQRLCERSGVRWFHSDNFAFLFRLYFFCSV